MQAEGPLLTIAQVATGLAGFSSIVIALRAPQSWTRQDRLGIGIVVAASVGALVGSLLPFPVAHLSRSEGMVWGVGTFFFGALLLVGTVVLALLQGSTRPRSPALFWFFVSVGFLLGLLLCFSAFEILVPRGPAMLLLGLLWAILGAVTQLITFLLVVGQPPPS